ncbi:methyltransferase domain-containing protein [Paenibacillus sp. F6_3S_P_1C]|uniref:Methyltransferase domain-containing protein n=1 Tax=Paenibacillus vandeheii TaxID=3035917 RepID=A0ABT8JA21_9BACL|nr:class I SAM-dependent methyltransferase [Paenibacillus vandeheii]MDN4601955.1 methyltransferase domain-containing protein [Paenibacillus vandeheii]
MTIHIDNTEEYDNPALYDQENNAYLEDVKFLSKWAANTNGVIIDIACGTGRATIPLAMEGHHLVGIDVHKGMLEEARNKTADLQLAIEWVEQDCTKLQLNVVSRLIYSIGNSFQHFLTNEAQDGLLCSVNKHLEMGGLFIFGTRFPSTEELLQPPIEEYWRSYVDSETYNAVDVYTLNRYDSVQQIQHYITTRKTKDGNGNIISEKGTNIRLRYTYPQEMERLLRTNGFKILHLYKDWQGTPLTEECYEMIYVCQKSEQCVTK